MAEQSSSDTLTEAIKRYLNLRFRYIKFLSTEKLSIILSASVLLVLLLLLGIIALCYFSLALVHWLAMYVGAIGAYSILGGATLLLILLLYLQRRRWILDPVAHFLARVLLNDDEDKDI